MEEDDLLEEDFRQERDLRAKLQRGAEEYRVPHPQGRGGFPNGGGHGGHGGRGHGFRDAPAPSHGVRFGREEGREGYGGCQADRNYQSGELIVDPRAQERRVADDRRFNEGNKGKQENKPSDIKCYRCLEQGHHQSVCTKLPVCYKCKEKGHMAVECPTMGEKKIQMFGFGNQGQGFYAMEIPENIANQALAVGVVSVQEGSAIEEKLNEDLRLVVNDKWDFQVKKLFLNDFMVTFPDKGTLATFSRMGFFELPIHKLKVKISISKQDPQATSRLQTYWVKIHNIPSAAREVSAVKGIASLVGQPVAVDELSLIRDEPVRVRVNCREPAVIRCIIEIFFNKEGHEVKFVAEGYEDRQLIYRGGPFGTGGQDDKRNPRNPGDRGDPQNKKKADKFDRITNIDKYQGANHGDSSEAYEADFINQNEEVHSQEALPIASFHPDLGMKEWTGININDDFASGGSQSKAMEVVSDYSGSDAGGSQLEAGTNAQLVDKESSANVEEPSDLSQQEENIPSEKILVHSLDGTYFMDKEKWPELILSKEKSVVSKNHMGIGGEDLYKGTISAVDYDKDFEIEELTQEDSLLNHGLAFSEGDDNDSDNQQAWVMFGSKKMKKQKKRKVMFATRTSSRVPKDGRTILEKAVQRVQSNDGGIGTSANNPFLVLNNLENEQIQSVASELDLVIENIDTQIDTFRAEERVRAALAEANYNEYLKKINKETAPQGEGELAEFSLSTIDNSNRGVGLLEPQEVQNSSKPGDKTNMGVGVIVSNADNILPSKRRGRPKKIKK